MCAALLLVAVTSTSAKCGPQTKVEMSSSSNAAGTKEFGEPVAPTDGACVAVASTGITDIKLCGPGKFTLSRMSCKRHDYKAEIYEHSASDYTTNCETVTLENTNVEGYLGSYSVEC